MVSSEERLSMSILSSNPCLLLSSLKVDSSILDSAMSRFILSSSELKLRGPEPRGLLKSGCPILKREPRPSALG
jgi:hypothetical protein